MIFLIIFNKKDRIAGKEDESNQNKITNGKMLAENTNSSSGLLYICTKQFNARLGDELNLKIGDKVEVLADDSEYNDGWYMGKNILTGEVGLYPKSFTQILQSGDLGNTLLRSRSRRVMNKKAAQDGNPTISRIADSMKNLGLSTDLFGTDSYSADADISNEMKNGSAPLSEKASISTQLVNKTLSDIDKALKELQNEGSMADISPMMHEAEVLNGTNHLRHISASSLKEDLDPHMARTWSPQQVSSYFAMFLGFDMDVAGKFARHKITGEILLELDLTYLKELDIDSFGTRFEIYKEIQKLNQLCRSERKGSTKIKLSPNTENSLIANLSDDDYDANVNSDNSSPYKMHSIPNNSDEDTNNTDYSKSQSQLLPAANLTSSTPSKGTNNKIYTHTRKLSKSVEFLPSNDSASNGDMFASPRKAPAPPLSGKLDNMSGMVLRKDDMKSSEGSDLYRTRTNASSIGPGHSRQSSSIYDQSIVGSSRNRYASASPGFDHRRNSSYISAHKRNSSSFSFLSGKDETDATKPKSRHPYIQGKEHIAFSKEKTPISTPLTSPLKSEKSDKRKSKYYSFSPQEFIDIDNAAMSPKKNSVSLQHSYPPKEKKDKYDKRAVSESSTLTRLKTLRTTSTQNFRSLTTLKKLKTSAFQEGIRQITPDEAIKTATFSGWMAKRSGNLGWKSRYFTLHGNRLLYFTSLKDKKEKGLIDITAHKVIPVNSESDSNDKYISMYASTAGFGRYCFKLMPPAPGFKKGLTFTQPKIHYFAVETDDEMRGWLKAIMTSTIDIDDSVPVVSSCNTPTVSLVKAQELLAQAREETKLRDEEMTHQGFDQDASDYGYTQYNSRVDDSTSTSELATQNAESPSETVFSKPAGPKLTVDTSASSYKAPTTPRVTSQSGFASPYLLASGLLSPRLATSGQNTTPSSTPINLDPYFESNSSVSHPHEKKKNETNSSFSLKKKKSDKMLAYSKDDSGNHTFIIKPKK